MEAYSPIRVIGPSEFVEGTAQTPGSKRLAAIAPGGSADSELWGGLFEVEPGARTGIHHHGKQQTIAYVLEGECEVRWGAQGEFSARAKAGDFLHVPAWTPHMEMNVSEFEAVSMGRRAQHVGAHRRELAGRRLAEGQGGSLLIGRRLG